MNGSAGLGKSGPANGALGCRHVRSWPITRRHFGRLLKDSTTHVSERTRAQFAHQRPTRYLLIHIFHSSDLLALLSLLSFLSPSTSLISTSTLQMDPLRKDILPYAASCNPPRRAKRPTTGGDPPVVEERAGQPLPALAPAIAALSVDVLLPVDDDDPDTADVPQPKRRGRKPSSLSRAARE